MKELGFNYRLTDFQALGITQLAKNQEVKRRNEISSITKKHSKEKLNFRIYLEEGITHTIYLLLRLKTEKNYMIFYTQKEF